MVMFIVRGIHSGLSQYSNGYAQANNKYMQSYNTLKISSYLMYYNVNNLYGWAMCQPLLGFSTDRCNQFYIIFNIMNIALDSPIGYILEVDLEYPQYLHDAHADLLFCPTSDKSLGKR